jgi:hypothetical protein
MTRGPGLVSVSHQSIRHSGANRRAASRFAKRWRAVLPFAASVLALASGALAETPQPAVKTLGLTYDVYAGGLHAFSFDVALALEPDGYRIVAEGGTRGFTAVLYTWNVRLAAEGAAVSPADKAAPAERLRPERYVTVNAGRAQPKTMRLALQPDGTFSIVRDPPETEDEREPDDLPAKLPPGIADPLSASLMATQALVETGRCEQRIPVFDGKRRYDLLIHDAGAGEVQKNRYSVYHGPATLCGFTMQRISGFKKQRRYANQWNEDKDEPPMLWIAKVREDLPPIPVRATAAVALGSIVVHLTRIEPGPEIASVSPP